MDTLVARYTSSPFDRAAFSDDDQQDFTQSIPSLSLRFALPPVPRVCYKSCLFILDFVADLVITAFSISPRNNR
jgi:hypothetical protein